MSFVEGIGVPTMGARFGRGIRASDAAAPGTLGTAHHGARDSHLHEDWRAGMRRSWGGDDMYGTIFVGDDYPLSDGEVQRLQTIQDGVKRRLQLSDTAVPSLEVTEGSTPSVTLLDSSSNQIRVTRPGLRLPDGDLEMLIARESTPSAFRLRRRTTARRIVNGLGIFAAGSGGIVGFLGLGFAGLAAATGGALPLGIVALGAAATGAVFGVGVATHLAVAWRTRSLGLRADREACRTNGDRDHLVRAILTVESPAPADQTPGLPGLYHQPLASDPSRRTRLARLGADVRTAAPAWSVTGGRTSANRPDSRSPRGDWTAAPPTTPGAARGRPQQQRPDREL